jgi:thiol-disulfide isomerase/thioredoxin|tara:strand:- start:2513 stop:3037 length:525 start_codon:yes stop_codon:yes gene_type:complete
MRNLILIAFLGFLTSCNAQQKETATKNKSGDLVGIANKESFTDDSYKGWFTKNYDSYKPDPVTITQLKKSLKGYQIKGFMGTWCGDSKRETPRFYKVLDEADFNLKNLELITVNRSKKTPDNLQEGLDIIKVPTFIIYKNNKEVGRFVERVRESLEKDILKIVSGQDYKHFYDN